MGPFVSQVMSVAEREWFLSGVRLGVLSVAARDRAPVTVPVWYAYRPGGELVFVTGTKSRKAELLRDTGRLSMCVHNNDPPYRYVTVEGPVTAIEEPATVRERTALAHRYLGPELGDRYLRCTTGDGLMLVRMLPEHWYSADFGKHAE
jgi:PPOX class probable F420-dependent enzyme